MEGNKNEAYEEVDESEEDYLGEELGEGIEDIEDLPYDEDVDLTGSEPKPLGGIYQ